MGIVNYNLFFFTYHDMEEDRTQGRGSAGEAGQKTQGNLFIQIKNGKLKMLEYELEQFHVQWYKKITYYIR